MISYGVLLLTIFDVVTVVRPSIASNWFASMLKLAQLLMCASTLG